jgi:hypothetical protein
VLNPYCEAKAAPREAEVGRWLTLSEAAVEKIVRDRLAGLGYAIATDVEIGPDGKMPEREAYADVVLGKRLISR